LCGRVRREFGRKEEGEREGEGEIERVMEKERKIDRGGG